MKAIVIHDLHRFQSTWSEAPLQHPFQSWEWTQARLRNLPSTSEPLVLAVTEGEKLLAIAPWEIRRTPHGLRLLTGMGDEDSWYHDPLTLDGDAVQVAACLADALGGLRNRWDVIRLSLPEDSPLLPPLRELGWFVPERHDWLQNSRIDLSEGWEAYWQNRPASLRKELRRSLRHLPPHRFLRADEHNLERMLGELYRLHSWRWGPQKKWQEYYGLIRALAWRALPRRELFLYGLELDGKLAAVNFALSCKGCFYGFMAAFRPEYSKLGIGSLLQLSQLEEACAEGIRCFNLGPGKFRWKEQLETGIIPSVQPIVFNKRSPIGWAIAARKALRR